MTRRVTASRILRSPSARSALELVLVVAAYFAAGKLGLAFARIHGSISLVWPPSGIALALVLLLGRRVWPAILLGAYLVNLTTTGALASSVGIAVGNTLEAVVGAWLVERFARGAGFFRRAPDVFRFALLAGLASTAVSAGVGVASLCAAGLAAWKGCLPLWLSWWVGDVAGDLVFAPLVILWASDPRLSWTPRRAAEAGLMFLSLVFVGQSIFGSLLPGQVHNYPLGFLCIPMLIWAATRFGPRETASAVAILSAMAVRGTIHSLGPFGHDGRNQALLWLELYTCVIAVTALALAAAFAERRRIEDTVVRALDELGLRYQRRRDDLSRAIQALKGEVQARISAERYAQAIVETIREPLLVLDPSLRVKSANPSFYRFFRLAHAEVRDRHLYDLENHGWDIPDLRALLEDVLPRNKPVDGFRIEHVFPKIGRKTLVLSASGIAQQGAPSELILLAFQDITERRQAEEALRISEAQFRAVAETALDAIISTNSLGQIIFFNPSAERIFGYTEDELLGHPLQTLMPARFRAAHQRGLARHLDTGSTNVVGRTVELAGLRKDGTEFPLELSVTNWTIGGEVFFTGIARDITQRRAAEQQLRESELALARAQALSRVGSWTWDFETDRLVGSRELFRIHGLKPQTDSVTSAALLETIHPQDRGLVEDHIRRARVPGASFECEYRIVSSGGEARWLHSYGETEADPSGARRMLGTAQDVTERKRVEQKVRQLNAELERRVQERTAELERSNLELQQFAYVAAHDLQEPLRTVAGFTQLLARRYRGKLDPEADELIAFAVDGVQWMSQLIEGLLVYSRAGSTELRLEPTDTEAVLERATNNLLRTITEQRAEVTHDPLPPVRADRAGLALVFQNLIANAIKFRSETPPHVHVGAEAQDNEWRFSVRDNGLGIEPRHLDRIFAIFQRLHSREEFPGTGIGLAICKRVVERHGGRIWATSAPGGGTTFWFTLPGETQDAERAAPNAARLPGTRESEVE